MASPLVKQEATHMAPAAFVRHTFMGFEAGERVDIERKEAGLYALSTDTKPAVEVAGDVLLSAAVYGWILFVNV